MLSFTTVYPCSISMLALPISLVILLVIGFAVIAILQRYWPASAQQQDLVNNQNVLGETLPPMAEDFNRREHGLGPSSFAARRSVWMAFAIQHCHLSVVLPCDWRTCWWKHAARLCIHINLLLLMLIIVLAVTKEPSISILCIFLASIGAGLLYMGVSKFAHDDVPHEHSDDGAAGGKQDAWHLVDNDDTISMDTTSMGQHHHYCTAKEERARGGGDFAYVHEECDGGPSTSYFPLDLMPDFAQCNKDFTNDDEIDISHLLPQPKDHAVRNMHDDFDEGGEGEDQQFTFDLTPPSGPRRTSLAGNISKRSSLWASPRCMSPTHGRGGNGQDDDDDLDIFSFGELDFMKIANTKIDETTMSGAGSPKGKSGQASSWASPRALSANDISFASESNKQLYSGGAAHHQEDDFSEHAEDDENNQQFVWSPRKEYASSPRKASGQRLPFHWQPRSPAPPVAAAVSLPNAVPFLRSSDDEDVTISASRYALHILRSPPLHIRPIAAAPGDPSLTFRLASSVAESFAPFSHPAMADHSASSDDDGDHARNRYALTVLRSPPLHVEGSSCAPRASRPAMTARQQSGEGGEQLRSPPLLPDDGLPSNMSMSDFHFTPSLVYEVPPIIGDDCGGEELAMPMRHCHPSAAAIRSPPAPAWFTAQAPLNSNGSHTVDGLSPRRIVGGGGGAPTYAGRIILVLLTSLLGLLLVAMALPAKMCSIVDNPTHYILLICCDALITCSAVGGWRHWMVTSSQMS